MLPLAARLRGCGFRPIPCSYPSVRCTPADNARALGRLVREQAVHGKVHLVAHSLGGLIALLALREQPDLPVGRLVLLGSPVHGSAVARSLAGRRLWRALLGQARTLLLSGAPVPSALPPTMVVAGTRSIGMGRLIHRALARPNDGMVSAAETALPGAGERLEVPVSHTGLLFSREVARAVCRFLREGGPG